MSYFNETENNFIFVTFGDGSKGWRDAATRISKEVKTQVAPQAIIKLDLKLLNYFDPKLSNVLENLSSYYPRGFGYWAWKPILLSHIFKLFPNNYILYVDAGSTFQINHNTESTWQDWKKKVRNNGALAWQLPNHAEIKWTKRELLNFTNCSDRERNSNQIQSGFIFLAPNQQNKKLIEQWLEISMLDNSFYLTDELRIPQYPDFIEHRHDQSIFSLLWKINNFPEFSDQTDPEICNQFSPLLATRNNTLFYYDINPIFRRNLSRVNLIMDFFR